MAKKASPTAPPWPESYRQSDGPVRIDPDPPAHPLSGREIRPGDDVESVAAAGLSDDPAPALASTPTAQQVQQAVVGMTPAQLTAILETVGQTNASAMRQSLRRENPDFNQKSVFHYPEGQRVRPKPTLQREVLFCGMRQRDDQLTPEEIQLFNRFQGNKSAHDGKWAAEILRRGSRELLMINVPANGLDKLMSLPNGLTLILRELLEGPDAVNTDKLHDRIAALEARLKDREAETAGGTRAST